MDPRKQECYGNYLFGAGYFADEDERLSVIGEENHFCQRCPRAPECNDAHRALVALHHGDEVEIYDRLMREAKARGIPEHAASFHLSQVGRHPYAKYAAANFSQGRTSRRKQKRLQGDVASSAG